MKRSEELTDDVPALLREIRGALVWNALLLMAVVLLLVAIVFGFAEVSVSPV